MTHTDSVTDFARLLAQSLDAGLGVTVLAGAGLSVPAGIPPTPVLHRYLISCIDKALKEDVRWSPGESDWPDIDLASVGPAAKSTLQAAVLRATRAGKPIAPLLLEAFGACATWRSSLHFLSRIHVSHDLPHKIILGAPDNEIIDSFFLHVVQGKVPSLEHRLLVSLSHLLRMHLILTSNFDSLIEDAFGDRRESITTFDVHKLASLPPVPALLKQRSLLKLHGGRYGLRADFGLDQRLPEEDEWRFAGYLNGGALRSADDHAPRPNRCRSNLLVVGLGGDDKDILSLVDFALAHVPHLHVFLVCYDTATLQRWRSNIVDRRSARFTTLLYPSRIGFFLLEVHQAVARSLPAAGVEFPVAWQQPSPPEPFEPKSSEEIQAFSLACRQLVEAYQRSTGCLVAEGPNEQIGIASACTHLLRHIQGHADGIWLELDQMVDSDDLFSRIHDAIHRSRQQTDPLPRPPHQDNPSQQLRWWSNALAAALRGTHRSWTIFLNARETAGVSVAPSWIDEQPQSEEGLPGDEARGWSDDEAERFWLLVSTLTKAQADDSGRTPIRVVVLLRAQSSDAIWRKRPPQFATWKPATTGIRLDPKARIRHVIEWLQRGAGDENSRARRFVYALTLFRRPRYEASLWTWAVFRVEPDLAHDNDDVRAAKATEWLRWLNDLSIVRRKRGGFIWMKTEVRDELRREIETAFGDELQGLAIELHESIADGYDRLYWASRDPLAGVEALTHRTQCAYAAVRRLRSGNIDAVATERLRAYILSSGVQATNTLLLVKERILAGGHSSSILWRLDSLAQGVSSWQKNQDARLLNAMAGWDDFTQELRDIKILINRLAGYLELSWENAKTWKARSTVVHATVPENYGRILVAIRARAFGTARADLDTLLQERFEGAFLLSKEATSMRAYRDAVSRWAAMHSGSAYWIARVLRRCMQLSLMEAYVSRLNHERGTQDAWDWLGKIAEVQRLYFGVLEVLRYVPDRDAGPSQTEQFWARTQLAAALYMKGAFTEARRRLNEAEGFLGLHPSREGRLWGVLEIRRAELCLSQLRALNGYIERRRNVDQAFRLIEADKAHSMGQEELLTQHWAHSEAALALVDDALSYLDRARPHLVASRRNAWWWSLWLELKVKCVEARLIAGPLDGSCRETLERGLAELDAHSADAMRIATDDMFRTMRVIQAHLTCLRAACLVVRRGERWTSAMKQSMDGILRCMTVAAEVQKRRMNLSHDLPLDAHVQAWTDRTLENSEMWLQALRRVEANSVPVNKSKTRALRIQ